MFKKMKHALQGVADVVIDFFEALLDMLVDIIQALDEEME